MRFIIPIIIVLFSACTNNQEDFIIQKELEMIDSLEQKMASINQSLDIDYLEIKERIEEMSIDIMKMRTTEKTFPMGMGVKMDKYEKIKETYEEFYEPFKSATTEASEINNQLLTLRESVIKQEFGKAKFKKYHALEQAAIDSLESYVKRHIQPVLDMEMEYRRIQKTIDQFLYKEEIDNLVK